MGRYSDGRGMSVTCIPGKRITKEESLRRREVRRRVDREAEARAERLTRHMKLDEDRPL